VCRCRLRTSNLVGGWCMRYQLQWSAIFFLFFIFVCFCTIFIFIIIIKACWSLVIAAGHTVSAAPDGGHTTCFRYSRCFRRTVWLRASAARIITTVAGGFLLLRVVMTSAELCWRSAGLNIYKAFMSVTLLLFVTVNKRSMLTLTV